MLVLLVAPTVKSVALRVVKRAPAVLAAVFVKYSPLLLAIEEVRKLPATAVDCFTMTKAGVKPISIARGDAVGSGKSDPLIAHI